MPRLDKDGAQGYNETNKAAAPLQRVGFLIISRTCKESRSFAKGGYFFLRTRTVKKMMYNASTISTVSPPTEEQPCRLLAPSSGVFCFS